jgi:ABC-2 type transport system ATP-binding protein
MMEHHPRSKVMNVVDVSDVTYKYGSMFALRGVSCTVPEGSLYALLGPNGSGKTTLLQILMGLRRPHSGRASVLGVDTTALTPRLKSTIGYVAEGQMLPSGMRIGEIEAYLAPLYDTWDVALANELRERFELDPTRKVEALSRGQQVKASLMFALAPRPQLLVMDEPFTGMDALVKDELVRGLLESAGSEGWTVLVCSHDIGELELLADWVGFLDRGMMRVSEPMDAVRERFKRVEVTVSSEATHPDRELPDEWLSVERSGQRLTFVTSEAAGAPIEQLVTTRLGAVSHIEVRNATLREIFVALARHRQSAEVAA